MSTAVTTWSLEQTAPDDLRPAAVPAAATCGSCGPRCPRRSSAASCTRRWAADIRWTDRLALAVRAVAGELERPGMETWVAYEQGTPAGYVELEPQDDGVVEIVYFGLLPDFRGRRIGGHLLSYGTARAWDLASAGRGGARPGGCGCTPARRTGRTRWTTTCGAASGSSTPVEEPTVPRPGPGPARTRPDLPRTTAT